MNRQEFMEQLMYLLGDLQSADREEAIRYYNDYFDEAGEENEADVISKLESPEKVAATIRQGLTGDDGAAGEYSETGYADPRFESGQYPTTQTSGSSQGTYTYGNPGGQASSQNSQRDANAQQGTYTYAERNASSEKKPMNMATKIVVGACIVFGAILLIPMAGGIFGGLLGIFVAIAAAVFSIAIAGISMIVAGVVTFFAGVSAFFTTGVATGFLMIGIALIIEAIGILLTMLGVWILIKIIPAAIRGIVSIFRRLLHKEEVNKI